VCGVRAREWKQGQQGLDQPVSKHMDVRGHRDDWLLELPRESASKEATYNKTMPNAREDIPHRLCAQLQNLPHTPRMPPEEPTTASWAGFRAVHRSRGWE